MSSSLQFQSSNDNLNHVFPQSQNRPYRGDSLNMWSTMSDGLPDTPPPEELNVPERTHDDQIHQSVTPPEEPLVAVIGIGYVGLHLITAFAPHYNIIAFDVSKKRLETVAPTLNRYSSITWTTNACRIAPATHFLIAVPTSLSPDKGIDTSYLREAINSIALYTRRGATVVVESSVAVGMTRQFLAPLMHSHGLKAGMSPEVYQ